MTICAFIVVKNHRNLLSWPILYNSPFLSVKGFTFLNNLYFSYINNVPSIHLVFFKNLHHSSIQAMYKTNLHLWFNQAHLWVLYYMVILTMHLQLHELCLAYIILSNHIRGTITNI